MQRCHVNRDCGNWLTHSSSETPQVLFQKWNITPVQWKIAEILPQEFSSYWENGLGETRWKGSSAFSTLFSAGEHSQTVYFNREQTEQRLRDFAVMASLEKSVFTHSVSVLFVLIITSCGLSSSIQAHKGIFQSFLNSWTFLYVFI